MLGVTRYGAAGSCEFWLGEALSGEVGKAIFVHGRVWQVVAWLGGVRRGKARSGMAGKAIIVQGGARLDLTGYGAVRLGNAWRGRENFIRGI